MGTKSAENALEVPAKAAVIGVFVPGRVENVICPAVNAVREFGRDWYRTVAENEAVNAPALVTMLGGTTNFGSPVESVIGAAVNAASAGYAVEVGTGVGFDTVPAVPPETVSDVPSLT